VCFLHFYFVQSPVRRAVIVRWIFNSPMKDLPPSFSFSEKLVEVQLACPLPLSVIGPPLQFAFQDEASACWPVGSNLHSGFGPFNPSAATFLNAVSTPSWNDAAVRQTLRVAGSLPPRGIPVAEEETSHCPAVGTALSCACAPQLAATTTHRTARTNPLFEQ
jgi:hypothetical protein